MTARRKRLKCYGCGSADLVLHETRYEHAEYDGGLIVNDEGCIQALSEGTAAPGDIRPELTRIECGACGYDWHPRRRFAGYGYDPDDGLNPTPETLTEEAGQ